MSRNNNPRPDSLDIQESADTIDVVVNLVGALRDDPEFVSVEDTLLVIKKQIERAARMENQELGTIVIRGNYEVQQAAQKAFNGVDVDGFTGFDWRGFLDDEDVMDMADEQTDDDTSIEELGVDDYDARDDVDFSDVSDVRCGKAKAKAYEVATHRLTDDYYDDYPTVDVGIVLHAGNTDGIQAVETMSRGKSRFVEYGIEDVPTLDFNAGSAVDWSPLIAVGDDPMSEALTDGQLADLMERFQAGDLTDDAEARLKRQLDEDELVKLQHGDAAALRADDEADAEADAAEAQPAD